MQINNTAIPYQGVIFKEIFEVNQGGATLDVTELPTTLKDLLSGTPLAFVTGDNMVHVVKTAVVYAGSTSTTLQIDKNNIFVVGDFIANENVSTAITAISTANAAYDELTLTAAMIVVADDVLNQGTSETTNDAVASTAVVEDAASDTLTATNPHGVNGVKMTISQNSSDALVVASAQGNLTIALADTTPANNTAATIQTAVQALGTIEGRDWSEWTFAAGANWDTAATGGTLTVPTDATAGGTEFNPLGIPPLYTASGLLKEGLDVEDAVLNSENVLASYLVRGTVNEVNLPYSLTPEIKTALTDLVRFE